MKAMKFYLPDSRENPCVPDLPVPMKNWLKFRKENGTRACREKAQTAETIVGGEGQRKMRRVKAILPEPQSSGFYPRRRCSDGCNIAPCSNRNATRSDRKEAWLLGASGPVSTACPPSAGSKGRTRHLPASHLLHRVTTGSPKRAQSRPVGRQSRHSSQRPEVMPRTAIFGWTAKEESRRTTGAGIRMGWAKGGSACESSQLTGGAC